MKKIGLPGIIFLILVFAISCANQLDSKLEEYIYEENEQGEAEGLNVTIQSEGKRKLTSEEIEMFKEKITNRAQEFGIPIPKIDKIDDNILAIKLPGIDDPRVAEIILQSAYLKFVTEDNQIVLTGTDLEDAYCEKGVDGKYYVALIFNNNGSKKFAEITTFNKGKRINIYLDDVLLAAPVIENPILDGKAIITGNFSSDDARDLAILIRSGFLPFKIRILEISGDNIGTIGEPFKIGEMIITVGTPQKNTTIQVPNKYISSIKSQGVFIEIPITIELQRGESNYLNRNQFVLIDSWGRRFKPTNSLDVALLEDTLSYYEQIHPGVPIKRRIFFDIAKNAYGLYLEINSLDETSSKRGYIKLEF